MGWQESNAVAQEAVTGQWQFLLPQLPPQSFFPLQGIAFSASSSQQALFSFSPITSFSQQLSLSLQARTVFVCAATNTSVHATVSNMDVKTFILDKNVFRLDLFLLEPDWDLVLAAKRAIFHPFSGFCPDPLKPPTGE